MMRRLRRAHVVFLGLGSMASWILSHLAVSGVGRVTAVDPDVVDHTTLGRQAFYGDTDVGKKKVRAAQKILERLNPDTSFDGVPKELSSSTAIADVLNDLQRRPNLVVLTADKPVWQIAAWASSACVRLGLPLLRANNMGVGPMRISDDDACPACEFTELSSRPDAASVLDHLASDRYDSAAHSATISTIIAMRASLAAHDAVGFLSSAWMPASKGTRVNVELVPAPVMTHDRIPQHGSCVSCSSSRANEPAAGRADGR